MEKKKMTKKFLIKLNGQYVERFYKNGVLVTANKNVAGRYTKAEADKHFEKWNLTNAVLEDAE